MNHYSLYTPSLSRRAAQRGTPGARYSARYSVHSPSSFARWICAAALLSVAPACSGNGAGSSASTDATPPGSSTTDADTGGSTEDASASGSTDAQATTGATADTSGATETTGATTGAPAAPVPSARFTLSGEGYDDVAYEWSEDAGNHVFCYFYSGASRGDYLWVRFAESPDQNGDSSPHIDLDLCRFTEDGPGGSFSAMDPTKHGPNCQADPGWGIWWHEGEVAYNNDPEAQDCTLTASVEGEVVTGSFSCAPLPEVDGERTLAVTEGSFSCIPVAK